MLFYCRNLIYQNFIFYFLLRKRNQYSYHIDELFNANDYDPELKLVNVIVAPDPEGKAHYEH